MQPSIQDLAICDPKGRECIEKNSSKNLHCNTTCVGMYADVRWVGENIYEGFKDRNVDEIETIQADLEGKIGDDSMKIFLLFENQMKHMKNEMQNLINGVENAMKIATGQSGQDGQRKVQDAHLRV